MFSTIISAAVCGMEVVTVHAEVDLAQGLPGFLMVGYLSSEVREAGERVRVALKNSGISLPSMRITVNLSPAGIRKSGTAFDLPIAVGILQAMGKIPGKSLEKLLIVGELSLDGAVNPVRGVLPLVQKAKREGMERCLVPMANYREGRFVEGIEVIGAADLTGVIEYLKNGKKKEISEEREKEARAETDKKEIFDFSDIRGQMTAKRAAEIAAAGFHNLLLLGPPGAGKTMIAKRIPSILPPLSEEECMEVSSIYSIAGLLGREKARISERPFIAPHHTITPQALVGGGKMVKPGLISLAHKGILFLDELPEFKVNVIDMLRQPLEERQVRIGRLGGNYVFPAEFMFVGAANPCPCGYFPDMTKCRCTQQAVSRYQTRISGPIRDRIDLCAEAEPITIRQLSRKERGESSRTIRDRVIRARNMQKERYLGKTYDCNALIPQSEIQGNCYLETREQHFMEKAYEALQLSARSYYRILRVARTIADLDGSEKIAELHLAEALEYRK